MRVYVHQHGGLPPLEAFTIGLVRTIPLHLGTAGSVCLPRTRYSHSDPLDTATALLEAGVWVSPWAGDYRPDATAIFFGMVWRTWTHALLLVLRALTHLVS